MSLGAYLFDFIFGTDTKGVPLRDGAVLHADNVPDDLPDVPFVTYQGGLLAHFANDDALHEGVILAELCEPGDTVDEAIRRFIFEGR